MATMQLSIGLWYVRCEAMLQYVAGLLGDAVSSRLSRGMTKVCGASSYTTTGVEAMHASSAVVWTEYTSINSSFPYLPTQLQRAWKARKS
jgi:hypothetical protein